MGKSIGTAPEVNPFNHALADDERFRLKDGMLTIEKSTVRSNASAWTRFWTRGQYSQKAILKEMSKLYTAAKNDELETKACHINNTFLENYKTLVGRATKQNDECAKMNSISRFLHAKREINVGKAQNLIDQIGTELNQIQAEEEQQAQEEAKIAAKAELKAKAKAILDKFEIKELIAYKVPIAQLTEKRAEEIEADFQAESTPWWDDQGLVGTDSIYDGFDYPVSTVETVLEPLGRKVKPGGNTTEELTGVLKALGLYEVQGYMDNKINGPLHLELYLLENEAELVQKLDKLPFIEIKKIIE